MEAGRQSDKGAGFQCDNQRSNPALATRGGGGGVPGSL